jgi:hypothetical protein
MVDTTRLVSDGEELVSTQAEPSRGSAEIDGRAKSLERRSEAGRPHGKKPDTRRGAWRSLLRSEGS